MQRKRWTMRASEKASGRRPEGSTRQRRMPPKPRCSCDQRRPRQSGERDSQQAHDVQCLVVVAQVDTIARISTARELATTSKAKRKSAPARWRAVPADPNRLVELAREVLLALPNIVRLQSAVHAGRATALRERSPAALAAVAQRNACPSTDRAVDARERGGLDRQCQLPPLQPALRKELTEVETHSPWSVGPSAWVD